MGNDVVSIKTHKVTQRKPSLGVTWELPDNAPHLLVVEMPELTNGTD
jgi:hypothetical protein